MFDAAEKVLHVDFVLVAGEGGGSSALVASMITVRVEVRPLVSMAV